MDNEVFIKDMAATAQTKERILEIYDAILNGVYTQSFNRRHGRTGHVFQGRYKAILIEKESYLLEVSRYVVLNPVRAKAVKEAKEWAWSSYRGTAGIEKPHACLRPDWILGQFGSKRGKAQEKYREFVNDGIRGSGIWKNVTGQSILGGDRGFSANPLLNNKQSS